jgi:hypothetical protein
MVAAMVFHRKNTLHTNKGRSRNAQRPPHIHMLLVITAAINVALPPADWPDGVSFAGAFTDHAVLQRAPQRAAVYGVVVSSSCNLTSSLAVQLSLWREAHTPMYPIRAQHIELVNCSYARWKAMLLPMPAGGSYELRAAVADTASAAAVLKDVTFGDVWFCSVSIEWLDSWKSYVGAERFL